MKRYSSVLLTVLLCTQVQVHAQVQSQNIDTDVDSEIDQMYQTAQPRKAQTRSNGQNQIVTQTVVVPQQQRTNVQTQPTTLIEASPLSDSRADNIRRNRQDEELKTE